MRLAIDHLAVSAATLAEGAAAVEAALGVGLTGGGDTPPWARTTGFCRWATSTSR